MGSKLDCIDKLKDISDKLCALGFLIPQMRDHSQSALNGISLMLEDVQNDIDKIQTFLDKERSND